MSSIESSLGKMTCLSIQLSLNIEEGGDQEYTITNKSNIGNILKSLTNKTRYIRRNNY
jgi:hypothetical protein